MKRFAALAALVAVAVAVGLHFGTHGGPAPPAVPKVHKNSIMDEATSRGIIDGYHAIRHEWGVYSYHAIGSDIALEYPNACGQRSCPQSIPLLWVEYARESQPRARQFLSLARARWPGRIQTFEIDHLDSHTPDARIMLIPKAGA